MEPKLTLQELIETVIRKMGEMDYAHNTILNYQRFYKRFLLYAENLGETYFSEEVGARYLKEKYNCIHDTIHENSPSKALATQVRYIRVLGDYQIHGIILRRKLGPTAASICPDPFNEAFEEYQAECNKRNLSAIGIYSRCNRIRHFIFFLNEHGISDYNEISPNVLSCYAKTFVNFSSKSIATELVSLRCFLRFLYQHGYSNLDLVDSLPKVKNYYSPVVPSTWRTETLEKVIFSIDRGNPTGKRDFAMILLIACYGIRSVDVKNLRLHHIHWEDNTIKFQQHKTGKEVCFPILKEVGWALIDYLKNGRPTTDSSAVFVRHNAPFEEFGTYSAMNRILVKYIRQSGIQISRDTPLGLHSLRHTLASRLLSENVPLPVISEILGHTSMKSTDIYLHIDHKQLLECALNPEEVNVDAKS